MPHRDWKFRIRDMIDAIAAVSEYTQGMDLNRNSERIPCSLLQGLKYQLIG